MARRADVDSVRFSGGTLQTISFSHEDPYLVAVVLGRDKRWEVVIHVGTFPAVDSIKETHRSRWRAVGAVERVFRGYGVTVLRKLRQEA